MPMVAQQIQINAVIVPSRLVPNKGPIRSVENLLKDRCTISDVESLTSLPSSGYPPTSFKTSTVSHVLRLFACAIPYTVATASS